MKIFSYEKFFMSRENFFLWFYKIFPFLLTEILSEYLKFCVHG